MFLVSKSLLPDNATFHGLIPGLHHIDRETETRERFGHNRV